jgi:hypothetical protein
MLLSRKEAMPSMDYNKWLIKLLILIKNTTLNTSLIVDQNQGQKGTETRWNL